MAEWAGIAGIDSIRHLGSNRQVDGAVNLIERKVVVLTA